MEGGSGWCQLLFVRHRKQRCLFPPSAPIQPMNAALERQPPRDSDNRGGAVGAVQRLSIHFPSQSSSEMVRYVL